MRGVVEIGPVNQASLGEPWGKCLQGLPVKKPELMSKNDRPFLVELLERKEVVLPSWDQARKEIIQELLERKKAALM
jgi:hypothetical protein